MNIEHGGKRCFFVAEELGGYFGIEQVGRIMMKGEGQELIGGISMVNYSSGIYFIQLLTSNSSRSFRILVY